MKVVLLKDVKNTGRAGNVIECASGHALNFLIPRGLAAPATATSIKQAEMRAEQADNRKQVESSLIRERVAALAEEPVVITKKANDKGHLYDAVDAREIAAAANIPVEIIRIEKPFKELGTFDVPVAFGEDFGKIAITIEAE